MKQQIRAILSRVRKEVFCVHWINLDKLSSNVTQDKMFGVFLNLGTFSSTRGFVADVSKSTKIVFSWKINKNVLFCVTRWKMFSWSSFYLRIFFINLLFTMFSPRSVSQHVVPCYPRFLNRLFSPVPHITWCQMWALGVLNPAVPCSWACWVLLWAAWEFTVWHQLLNHPISLFSFYLELTTLGFCFFSRFLFGVTDVIKEDIEATFFASFACLSSFL